MKNGCTSVLAILVTLAALAVPLRISAESVERSTSFSVEGAYYLADNKGRGVADGGFAPISYTPVPPVGLVAIGLDDGRNLGSKWGPAEIQFELKHTIQVPVLAGSGALTADNNAAFSAAAALTPVSARLEVGATLTPIAFLNLFAGAMVGTGWNIGVFDGLGLNADGSGVPDPASFEGLVVKHWVGGTFQFDLAALVPGDWTHVVMLLRPRVQYAWFSGADRGEAWMWEADIGENFNGWKLFGSYFLGYQMPLVLNTVGILLETEQHLGYAAELSPMAANGWGSDFVLLTLGSVMNFTVSKNSSLAVLVQLRRERLYTDATLFYEYYANRSYDGAYWDLYRVAFSYSLEL